MFRQTTIAALACWLGCTAPVAGAKAEQGGATLKRPSTSVVSAGKTDPRSRPHRVQTDRAEPPLPIAAIGVIEADDGSCTATMVTDTLALTAAHCIFDPLNRVRVPERFRGGYRDGAFTVESLIIRAYMQPGFDLKRYNRTIDLDGRDWALIELADPIGKVTGTVPVIALNDRQFDALGDGSDGFVQVGYGSSDGEAPVVLYGCTVLTTWDDYSFGHLCGTVAGDSGGPDLTLVDGKWMIFGIESGNTDAGDMKDINMAVSAEAFAPEIQKRGGTVH